MFYKIEKGHKLYNSFQKVKERMELAQKETLAFLDSVPNSLQSYYPENGIAGGVRGVGFKREDLPEDWIVIHKTGGEVYAAPHGRKKSVKEIREKIKSLPQVDRYAINGLVNYDWAITEGAIWFRPVFSFRGDVVLISVAKEQIEAGYKPVDGMIEITCSEYNKIAEQKLEK